MHVPFSEMLKSVPGAIGIRLEKELPFDIVKTFGDIELRRYPAFTLARTSFQGDFDRASEVCFKRLAEFIFGENAQHKVTEMTTPVFYDREGDMWTMSFYVPEDQEYLIPNDSEIKIENRPMKDVAVFTFSGIFNEESMGEAKSQLLEGLSDYGLLATSEIWWAQYDQPVSLPFTKRNEVFVMVEEKAGLA